MTLDLGVSDRGHEEACVECRSGLGESEEKSQRWEQEDETTEQQNGGSRERAWKMVALGAALTCTCSHLW